MRTTLIRDKQGFTKPICPNCGHQGDIAVADTRTRDGIKITRRRICPHCHHRWSTLEIPREIFREIFKAIKPYL